MNPLTEEQLREKIAKVMSDWGVDFYEGNLIHREEQRLSIIRGFQDAMINIIMEDRKAWGEYVIGKDPVRLKNIEWMRNIESEIDRATTFDKAKELQHRLDVAKSFAFGYDKGVNTILELKHNQKENK